jgi:hypothetical protein
MTKWLHVITTVAESHGVKTVIKPAWRSVDVTRYGSERAGTVGAIAALALGWTLALGGLVGTLSIIPGLGWNRAPWVAVLWCFFPFAMWMTRRVIASRRLRAIVPPPVMERRHHGDLTTITDDAWRPLRPIGRTAQEVAERTGALLADLVAIPCVRIFHGIHAAGAGLPLISHAISAGRQLVLIESVAWPPGCYETGANGRIYCDGMYIGQTVSPLVAAVRHWQELLPQNHRVTAMIVVHAAAGDSITLPASRQKTLTWVPAGEAVGSILQRISNGHQSVSRNAIAALLVATTSPL